MPIADAKCSVWNNLASRFALFAEHRRPKVVAELNDDQFTRIALPATSLGKSSGTPTKPLSCSAASAGRFPGRRGDARNGRDVRRAEVHRTKAIRSDGGQALLVEPREGPNTGGAGGERRAQTDLWI